MSNLGLVGPEIFQKKGKSHITGSEGRVHGVSGKQATRPKDNMVILLIHQVNFI